MRIMTQENEALLDQLIALAGSPDTLMRAWRRAMAQHGTPTMRQIIRCVLEDAQQQEPDTMPDTPVTDADAIAWLQKRVAYLDEFLRYQGSDAHRHPREQTELACARRALAWAEDAQRVDALERLAEREWDQVVIQMSSESETFTIGPHAEIASRWDAHGPTLRAALDAARQREGGA